MMRSEAQPGKLRHGNVQNWLDTLSKESGSFYALLNEAEATSGNGFHHTIQEICQQPVTWSQTAAHIASVRDIFPASMEGCGRILLTGSGSSQYAADCVAPVLARELGIPVEARAAGDLLLIRGSGSEPGNSTLVVSLARSGESPESV